ncbi:hypothetical protein P3W85_24355 [Cupriavidus basilensis]|uniref:Uncharacterized protein n=1 Tax=Cupriavidus basilensis TaxID=68895 RepID=A0ABT6ATV2_9BURK|nr:hypothetical protein [Cupriavidus basilensis]MDF3836060.1 hypothetical protein [Cupriavidus basilensis]
MKYRYAWCALTLMAPIASASPIFDGYESYYASQSGALFNARDSKTLQSYSLYPDNTVQQGWEGIANGHRQSVKVADGNIQLNGRKLRLTRARLFPGESTTPDDLGRGTEVYFANGYVCLENTPSSASGTAARHMAVYLIRTGSTPQLFKLPSLFASCLGIRRVGGDIAFPRVTYDYALQRDVPDGVVFTEYRLRGQGFVATSRQVAARFVEAGNVYRFTITSPQSTGEAP